MNMMRRTLAFVLAVLLTVSIMPVSVLAEDECTTAEACANGHVGECPLAQKSTDTEAEAAKKLAEEEAAKKQAEEEAAKKQAEEEAAKKQAEEEAAKKQAEEEAAKKQAEEEAAKKQAEEEAAKKQAEEEAAKKQAEEEAAKKQAEEEAAKKQAEEEAAKKQAEEEAAKKQAEEEAAKKQAEEEAARQAAIETLNGMIAALPSPDEIRFYTDAEKEAFYYDSLVPIHTYAQENGINIDGDLTWNAANEGMNAPSYIPTGTPFDVLRTAEAGATVTIELTENAEMSDWTWLSFNGNLTIKGNGHTVSGLKVPLLGSIAGTVKIENLTVSGTSIPDTCTDGISGDGQTAFGAFIGWVNGGCNVSITGCTVTGASISNDDGWIGGFVGFGDQGSSITISSSTVTGSTFTTAAGAIGGIGGYLDAGSGSVIKVQDCTVTNNTFTTAESRAAGNHKVGTILGSGGYGTTTIRATENGNTVNAKNSDGTATNVRSPIGRTLGGQVTIVGGSYQTDENWFSYLDAKNTVLKVTGGKFGAAVPAEYLPSGYLCKADTYEVVEGMAVVVGGQTVEMSFGDIAASAETAISVPLSSDSTSQVPGELFEAVKAKDDVAISIPVTVTVDSGNSTTAVTNVQPVVTFDQAAVAVIAAEGADVTLEVAPVSQDSKPEAAPEEAVVFDITLTANGAPISDFGTGTVTVQLPAPADITDAQLNEGWAVYYYDNSGKKSQVSARFAGGKAIVKTNHFSTYSIEPLDHTLWYDEDQTEFTITTLDQLKGFAQLVNEGTTFAGKTVKLGANIDLNNEEWTPIGTSSNRFLGTFDGQNNVISNLTITGNNSCVGLFGFVGQAESSTVIQNVRINGANISGANGVGVIVGESFGGVTIRNCHVYGNVTVSAASHAGGIGGKTYATFENCSVTGTAEAPVSITASTCYAGGIAGSRGWGDYALQDCAVSYATITAADGAAGGLSGLIHCGNTASDNTVSNCSVVTQHTNDKLIGLLVGSNNGAVNALTFLLNNTVTNTTAKNNGVAVNADTGLHTNEINIPATYIGKNVVLQGEKIVSGVFTMFNETAAANVLAPNSDFTKNADGTYTVSQYVAKIGEKKYETVEAAVQAAGADDTIILLDDVAADVTVSKDVTLDLAGFDVQQITVAANKTLTLVSTGDGADTHLVLEAGAKVKKTPGALFNLRVPDTCIWYNTESVDILYVMEAANLRFEPKEARVDRQDGSYVLPLKKDTTAEVTYTFQPALEDGITFDPVTKTLDFRGLAALDSPIIIHIQASTAPKDQYPGSEDIFFLTIREGVVEADTEDVEVVFDNRPHSITVTVPTGATVKYKTTADGEYGSTNPQFTDVGTYMVLYKASMDGYGDSYGSATLEITKATQSISYAQTSLRKNLADSSKKLTNALTETKVFGDVTYQSSNTNVATVDEDGEVTVKAVGTTTIKATAAGHSKNYDKAEATYTLTVYEDQGGAELVTPVTGQKLYVSDISDEDAETFEEALDGKFSHIAKRFDDAWAVELKLINTQTGQEIETKKPIEFLLAYPADSGITAKNYDKFCLVALHIKDDGTIEEIPLTATKDGAKGTSTLSPFLIAYKEGHDYETEFSNKHHWDECQDCGHTTEKETHSFKAWRTIREARKDRDGMDRRDCKHCDYYETRTYAWYMSPFTGDNFGASVIVMAVSGLGLVAALAYWIINKKKGKK